MKRLAVLLIALLAAACSPPLPQTSAAPEGLRAPSRAPRFRAGSSPIRHVIVIMQENRSFDNLFHGFPNANTVTSGAGKGGKRYTLQKLPLKWAWDLRHDHPQFLEDYDRAKIDGFNGQIHSFKTGSGCADAINHPACWIIYSDGQIERMAYSYVDRSQIQPYWTMASEYALGDDTFATNNGPSFPSHQYLIAAQSGHASEVPDGQPWGCDAPPSVTVDLLAYGQASPPVFSKATGHETAGPRPCFTYTTLADLLDAAHVSWSYYTAWPATSGLSAFDAIEAVRHGADWKNVKAPDTKIFDDITGNSLAQVSWVIPTGSKSDHAGPNSGSHGPDWVASIVNAIGNSPYWNSTAIIVMWDEWGGWYDHVTPPQYPDPKTGAYEGLGFRVPLIVVSPYAKAHYVSHRQHEIASSVHFIEETFGLPSLDGADARADAFDDMFDFMQPPIPFSPIPTVVDSRYFAAHDSPAPADDY
ncbi:MAG: alkaline phosphatase family protein [Candidatus Tumulicola sp.]